MVNKSINNKIKKVMIAIFIFAFCSMLLNAGTSRVEAKTSSKSTESNVVKETTTINHNLKDETSSYLSSLSIDGYNLNPTFEKNVTDYICVISKSVTKLDVQANAEDSEAKVKITGNTKLSQNENSIKISVTPKVGQVRTYTIKAVKTQENSLTLDSLSIEGATLSPEFEKDVYYYETEITTGDDKGIAELPVNATSNNSNAKIEIVGNKNLVEGNNLISIVLEDDDDNVTTYQVNVMVRVNKTFVTTTQSGIGKFTESCKNFFKDEKNIFYVLVAIAIILLICIITLIKSMISSSKAKKNKDRIKNRAK